MDAKKITDIVNEVKRTAGYSVISSMSRDKVINMFTGIIDAKTAQEYKCSNEYREYVKAVVQSGIITPARMIAQGALHSVFYLWSEHKNCYTFHKQLLKDFLEADTVEFDTTNLLHLPFPEVYCDISKLGVCLNGHDLYGFFASVRKADNENTICFQVVLWMSGNTYDQYGLFIKPDRHESYTVNSLFHVSAGVDIDRMYHDHPWLEALPVINKLVFGSLCYLLTDEKDVVPAVSSHKPSSNLKGLIPVKEWEVGYRVGPQVIKAKKQYEKLLAEYEADTTGKKVRPHIRKAHWHHYWTGHGDDKKLVLRFLQPMPINCDDADLLPIVDRIAK